MRKFTTYFCIAALLVLIHCAQKGDIPADIAEAYPEALTVRVENMADFQRTDGSFSLRVDNLKELDPDFNPLAFVIFREGIELPSQGNDLDGDGDVDQVVCLADFQSGETKELTVRFAASGEKQRSYAQRAYGELSHKAGGHFEDQMYLGGTFTNVEYLRVPPEHTDHSTFIRYEGPGWESDKVGYRFYLDWRNAIDIFGKKVDRMVLPNIGQDGFDSYHEMSVWGMDVLKVGESLGIGSVGMWAGDTTERVAQTDSITCAVIADGPIQALIRTHYYGWSVGGREYDLVSDQSIVAGSRATRHTLQIEPNPGNLCTGIVKHPEGKLIADPETRSEWTYLATYGRQSLADDNLGMAVFYRREDLIELTEDQHSLVTILQPRAGKLTYYFLAAWEMERDGIQTEDEFIEYLGMLERELSEPITIVQ
jgi:hypothetical protein